jgi:hypothetical protein
MMSTPTLSPSFWDALTGKSAPRMPRKKTAKRCFAEFVHQQLQQNTAIVMTRHPQKKRARVRKEELEKLWRQLSKEAKERWGWQREAIYKREIGEFNETLNRMPSDRPEDMQA